MCRSSLTRLHVRLMLPLHRFVSMTQSRTHRKDTHCRGALANCFRDGAPENAGTERLAWQPGTSARVASASSDASESRKRERSWEIERSHCCGTCTTHSAGQRRVSTWSTGDETNKQGWGVCMESHGPPQQCLEPGRWRRRRRRCPRPMYLRDARAEPQTRSTPPPWLAGARRWCHAHFGSQSPAAGC